MAATRKRKSTRTPAKSKKAKAEEAIEEPAVEETPADDPPAAEDANEATAAAEEEEAKIVQADSKDTHEAAEALLAVSGGDGKSAVKNGEGELHLIYCVHKNLMCICIGVIARLLIIWPGS
jgi:hypothetical protein